jgi:hypothetical protein
MSHIPVQYNGKKAKASLVIRNDQDDKDCAEEMICKLLGIRKTKGKVTFGPSMTAEECLIYNQGYTAGIASKIKNTVVIDVPEIKDKDGKVLISGSKKRERE